MRNKFLLLALLLFSSFSAFAQILNQGKVLLTDGREIAGKVGYLFQEPHEIFVFDASGKKVSYEPSDVKEIILDNGHRYVSKTYNSKQTIFQIVILSENMSFYKRELNQVEYYVAKQDDIHRLENNEITITVDSKRKYKKPDYKYIGTLTMLMQDRADLIEKIQNTKFTEKDIAALVTAYNRGEIAFVNESENTIDRKAYLVPYAQLTKHDSYKESKITKQSAGLQLGLQFYFSEISRSSLRLGFDYAKFEFDKQFHNGFGYRDASWSYEHRLVSATYQYDFIQKSRFKAYLLVHFLDMGSYSVKDIRYYRSDDKTEGMFFRFNPGTGLSYRPIGPLTLYVEANKVHQTKSLLGNYSFGLKFYPKKK